MLDRVGKRKQRKFAGDVCYFCGASDGTLENEDIPGRLFGVSADGGGLLVPVCRSCNRAWNQDQEFFRLRAVFHAGSQQGSIHAKEREISRLTGSPQKKPQQGRYSKERVKLYLVNGKEYMGLTDDDFSRMENVVRHWAAGVHYGQSERRAALPGSVHSKLLQPEFFRRVSLRMQPDGIWKVTNGSQFGCWWFMPGPDPSESITIIKILEGDLWFAVCFPAAIGRPGSSHAQQAV